MRNLIPLYVVVFTLGCSGGGPGTQKVEDPTPPEDPNTPGGGSTVDPSIVSPPTGNPSTPSDPMDPTNPTDPGTMDPANPPGVTPKNVSFTAQVVPIFNKRGCEPCHSGNGIGKDLGNLTLDGSNNLMFKEVAAEMSPDYKRTRVDVKVPAASLVLTLPSGADAHPVVVFKDTTDPDYQVLRVWIEEGAKFN
jgi:hypothetical protein